MEITMELDENQMMIPVPANGRTHYYVFDKTSPLGEIYDVICALRQHILQVMQNDNKAITASSTQDVKE